MIVNLHRMFTKNVGDLFCAPAQYFPLGDRMEILGWKQSECQDVETRKLWKEKFQEASTIVVGGGGLLCSDFFKPGLDYIFQEKNPDTRVVIWGAGHNEWQLSDWRKIKCEIELPHPYDLIGVRDFGHQHEWVPCPSCLHPAFDAVTPPEHEVVLYAHEATLLNPKTRAVLPTEFPTLSNSADFETAIKFLSSGDLVLTDSYHGLYWATLLGRRVIAFPTSSKFYDVKHAAPLCDPRDWQRFANLAVRYPLALRECRDANTRFYEKVMQLAG